MGEWVDVQTHGCVRSELTYTVWVGERMDGKIKGWMHEWISIHIHIGECTYTHMNN